jgi:hypothetical protein
VPNVLLFSKHKINLARLTPSWRFTPSRGNART